MSKLFKSKGPRKRLKRMMSDARENSDKVYNLSECGLHEIPTRAFEMCSLLQKESLLLHSNFLKSLKSGGSLLYLMNLKVLDLHNNKLTSLPNKICTLKNLQVLNVERNELSALPYMIGNLTNLQTLNVRDNQLNCIPATIDGAKNLRELNISGTNRIRYLTKSLCKVQTLEVLTLENPAFMEYPPPHIAEQGLQEIMKFMCRDCSFEYVPPHKTLEYKEPTTIADEPKSQQGETLDVEKFAF